MSAMSQVSFQWKAFDALNLAQLYQLLRLRQQVFIVEQQSIYDDIDNEDQHSMHGLLSSKERLVGYIRLRVLTDIIKIERVVLEPESRGKKLGMVLMNQALDKATDLNARLPLMLSAQTEAQQFYQQWGFKVCSSAYDDGGILHVDMRREPGESQRRRTTSG